MELYIRNKWVSLGGSSVVKDKNDNDVLMVKGKIFTFTRKKYVKDMEGNTLFIVRNKFWFLFHRQAFIFTPEKEQIGYVRRKIFSFHDHYDISSKYGEVVLRGNILGYDYHITLNGQEIGHVARKISLRDSFVLEINDDVDWQYFVALVIALDNIVDSIRSSNSSVSYSD